MALPFAAAGQLVYLYGTDSGELPAGQVDDVFTYDQSSYTLSGGTVTGSLRSTDDSSLHVTGGAIASIVTRGHSSADFEGGALSSGFALYDYSHGSIGGGSLAFAATNDSSTLEMSGGSLGTLYGFGGSSIGITGGSIGLMYAYADSHIEIWGLDFGSYGAGTYHREDFADNGNGFNATILDIMFGDGSSTSLALRGAGSSSAIRWDGELVLHLLGSAVPEPAEVGGLGAGGLAALLIVRRRRRTRA